VNSSALKLFEGTGLQYRLLKVVRAGKLRPGELVTHRFAMNDIMKAYDTFGNAAKEGALKVVLTNTGAH
jgi:alcohol dehydrogenase